MRICHALRAASVTSLFKFIGNTQSTASTISTPADTSAGDILILVDYAIAKIGEPTLLAPSGFTSLHSLSLNGRSTLISVGKASSNGAYSIQGMFGTLLMSKQLLCIRCAPGVASFTGVSFTGAVFTEITTARSFNASSVTLPGLVVIVKWGGPTTSDADVVIDGFIHVWLMDSTGDKNTKTTSSGYESGYSTGYIQCNL